MKNIENEVKLEIKHHVPIRKKVKAIQDYSLGISSVQELAEELKVVTQTILNWVDNSKKIFAQCYISDSINTGATDNLEASEEASRLPTDIDIQTDLIKKNKELKKAHEWDENRIAYLESLLELNNIDQKTISKKKGHKQSSMPLKTKK
jgi:transposase-like protein